MKKLNIQFLCVVFFWLTTMNGSLALSETIPLNEEYAIASTYADVDGDGVKEAFILSNTLYSRPVEGDGWGWTPYEDYYCCEIAWLKSDGTKIFVTDLGESAVSLESRYILHDLNNDEIPDFFYWPKGWVGTDSCEEYEFCVAYSSVSRYTVQKVDFTLPYNTQWNPNMLAFGDFNRDGREDIFHYETFNPNASGSKAVFTPYLYLQTKEGNFLRTPFPETANADAIDNALYSSGQSGAFSMYVPVMIDRPTNLIPANKANLEGGWQIIDLNQDGYLDVISTSGLSYISLQDGTWYQADIAGTVGMSDFNQDGVKDLVVFDSESGQVDVLMSSPSGMAQSSLYNNANISHVICEDMDADGRSDVLLLASVNPYQYFLFFKNKGDGTFKRSEKSLAGTYEYNGLYHLQSNGLPTVIFWNKDNSCFKRVEWDSNFKLTESDLFTSGWTAYTGDPISVNDFYCDGQFYIKANSQNINGFHLYPLSNGVATRPDKLGAPSVIVDNANGLVKVVWQAGNDAETSPYDFNYEVKVIASGATQASLLTRTAGNLSLIFDPSTWEQGEYEVQVRAINKKNLASEWSEVVAFTNSALPTAAFALSETTLYMVDTLTVTSLSGEALNIQVLPEGEIVSNENGVARIVFNEFGYKTVRATTAGNIASEQTLYVEPFKLPEEHTVELFNGYALFDYNQEGKLAGWGDFWSDGGFYTMEQGVGTLYPSLNLSDVKVDGLSEADYIVDNNRDGLPDVMGRIEKNGTIYSVMHNLGDYDFDFQAELTREEDGAIVDLRYGKLADFNNDGFVDFFARVYLNNNEYEYALYQNTGSNVVKKVFSDKDLTSVTEFADLNNDGYLDIVTTNCIYLNKGDFNFEKITRSYYNNKCEDVNYDGILDLVYTNDKEPYAALGNGDGTFSTVITLPGELLLHDFDNDGRWDYLVEDSLYLDRTGGAISTSTYEFDINGSGGISALYVKNLFDIDEDGYPDHRRAYKTTKTRIANTAPTAPTKVFVRQTDSEVVVSWEGATDRETPAILLSYNLSVREKGTNNYIISPLNNTKNEALTVYPRYNHYRRATLYPIPFGEFTAGKTYEICVQTIDTWFEHSDFSSVVEFVPAEKVLISLPTKGGVNVPVEFEYASNSGTPTIIADGGTISGKTITWDTPGEKSVTAISGTTMSTQAITIVERPDLMFGLPGSVLAQTEFTVALPQIVLEQGAEFQLLANSNKVGVEVVNGVATVVAQQVGEYTLTLTYNDPIFGEMEYSETFTAVENIKPTIQMVTVEGENNNISWSHSERLTSPYDGNVHIYKETTIANQYELLATVAYNAGSYVDETAYADVRSSRYKLALSTVYGAESSHSDVHGSIHLMINQGMGYDVNLHWTPYVGAEIMQYTILSGPSADNLSTLEYISGNAQSFTHKRTSDANTYYALAYTLKEVRTLTRSITASAEGFSNVICSNSAYAVTPVESITIGCREDNMLLSNDQMQLHLNATLSPISITLNRVVWSIISGGEYASVSSDGVITLTTTERASGVIVVQAAAVDGSGVTATANIIFNHESAVESIVCDNQKVKRAYKVLENGKVYIILPTGEKYTVEGIRVE